MEENEIWKDIYEYEGLYQVSNFGNVRSLPRNKVKGKLLNQEKTRNNYLRVSLSKDGKTQHMLVHRLVAYAFIPNDDLFKTDINHIDENTMNNNVNNLEWCDKVYNNNYGSRKDKASKSLTNRKDESKRVAQYSLDGKLLKIWPSVKEITRNFKTCERSITNCCNGGHFDKRRNKFVNVSQSNGFIWKYVE